MNLLSNAQLEKQCACQTKRVVKTAQEPRIAADSGQFEQFTFIRVRATCFLTTESTEDTEIRSGLIDSVCSVLSVVISDADT